MTSPAIRSTPSAESLPEFFIDRCLAHPVGKGLADLGWAVHVVNHQFPNDAQEISDEEWIKHGLSRGWSLLTQDSKIRYRAKELSVVADGQCAMFCLNSGNLRIATKVAWFHASQAKIYREARKARAAFFVVYEDNISKMWP